MLNKLLLKDVLKVCRNLSLNIFYFKNYIYCILKTWIFKSFFMHKKGDSYEKWINFKS